MVLLVSINMNRKPVGVSFIISIIMLISLLSGCISSNENESNIVNNSPIIESEVIEDIFLSDAGLILLSVTDEDIDTLSTDASINDFPIDSFLKNSEVNGWSIVISISNLEIGNHKLKVIATDNYDQQATWMSIISIIADPIDGISDNETEDSNEDSDENSIEEILGCTDPDAINYNSEANEDDDSCTYPIPQVKKIMALHGGGQSANQMEQDYGIQDLIEALPEYEFFFPETPENGDVWVRDPPGGKEEGTTDPGWADDSINYLDNYIEQNGPFYAILGFSQGAAMSVIYLAYSDVIFEKVILMNGYLETGHQGLMDTIEINTPFQEPALVFEGEDDDWFGYGSAELADIFSNSTHLIGDAAHHPPYESDRTFQEVVNWIKESQEVTNPEINDIVSEEIEWWSEILLCDDDQNALFDDYNTSQNDNHQCDLSFTIDSGNITISTNGLPNHDFESRPGCCSSEQTTTYTIPVNPTNDTDCFPSVSTDGCTMAPERGAVAFAVNGVPIYGPEDGPGGDAVASQEGAYEEDRQHIWLGICHGHNGPGGIYHYHADSNCVHWHPEDNQTWNDYSIDSSRNISKHSKIVGFAFDGYPIYGFIGWDEDGDVKEMTSSYKLKDGANGYNGIEDYEYVTGLGDLDSCNGHFGVTPEFPNGTYHYHTTWENGEGGIGFPYFINCYRGELLTNDGDENGEDPCAGEGETWGPGIGPPPDDCDSGPPPMSTELDPGVWIYYKSPPIVGIITILIMCVVLIYRFKSKAFSEDVLDLVGTIDVCHRDPVLT